MNPGTAAATRPLERVVKLEDFEPLARERLSPMAFEYVAGGAGEEVTLRRNREAWNEVTLAPRVLRDVSRVDLSLELLGQGLDFPILLAPTGYQGLMHPGGEREAARGAAAANAVYVVSSVANTPLDEIARAAPGLRWYQLYVQKDRGWTREIVARAEASGYRALMLTVDTPVLGARDREKREGFALPPGLSLPNFPPLPGAYTASVHHAPDSIYNPFLDPGMTWEAVAWLRSISTLPVVLKGVLAPEDAALAVQHGAAAVVVSNHGGRLLDGAPATAVALPRVVETVAGRVPVLVDGGIRRGSDVLRALALGAHAVLIGRPYVWGLATAGAAGVERVVRMLRLELEGAMALAGLRSLAEVGRDALWR